LVLAALRLRRPEPSSEFSALLDDALALHGRGARATLIDRLRSIVADFEKRYPAAALDAGREG
jgi:hypothetical protein